MAVVRCPSCGRDVDDSAFCRGCGAPLTGAPTSTAAVDRPGRRSAVLLGVVVAALLALIGGGIAFALVSGGDEDDEDTVSAEPSPTYEPAPTYEPTYEPPPEETYEPSPEPPSCTDESIQFTVLEQGFTFFRQYDQNQVSYALVLKNPSSTCATSSVNLDVDFLNAAGDVISTETVPLGAVAPGGTTALADTTFVDERPTKLEFGNQAASGQDPSTGAITVSNVRQTSDSVGTKFTGRLRSTLPEPVSARVAVVLRRSGKVIGGAYTYRDLPHNGTGAFEAHTLAQLPTGVPSAYVTW
jgi:ABC-type cobalt transport system substrate-binding protein